MLLRGLTLTYRKFSQIVKDLEDLKSGNRVLRYLMAKDDSGILSGIAEDINAAIVDYQLSLQQETYTEILNLIVSYIWYLNLIDLNIF